MIEQSKHVRLTNAPETEPEEPQWPGYEPLWSTAKVIARIDAETKPAFHDYYVEEAAVQDLMLEMRTDYDRALADALFELWQYTGMNDKDDNPPPSP